jgi:D-glycero-D-manno-heptose 1,7-bisphosphate phosphatase
MNLKGLSFDTSWTLFLDRDGVINRQIPGDYIRKPGNFVFLPGVLSAMRVLSTKFGRIIIVTNQQGIGKGLMTNKEFGKVNGRMISGITEAGGRIDRVYVSPFLETSNHPDRKPGPGMALKARMDFPEIDFQRSIMVGDSRSDMEFGKNLGMFTVLVGKAEEMMGGEPADAYFHDLPAFVRALEE